MVAPKNAKLMCINFVALLTTTEENQSIPKLSSFPLSDEALYQVVLYFIKAGLLG